MHKHSKEYYTLVTVLQHSMEPVLQSARGMTGLAAARRGVVAKIARETVRENIILGDVKAGVQVGHSTGRVNP